MLALLFTLSAACTGSPAQPDAGALTGRWDGTFTVTGCEWSGSYRGCGIEIGATTFAGLLFLEPVGASVQGYGQFSPFRQDVLRREGLLNGFVHPFTVSPRDDGTMQFGGGTGIGPTAVYEYQWDLKLATPDRLEGTLRARNSFYKVQGDTVLTGTVSLTRTSGN